MALTDQDFAAAAACVDRQRYRENCVGFTGGFVDWDEAVASVSKVFEGISDLHVDVIDLAEDSDRVYVRARPAELIPAA